MFPFKLLRSEASTANLLEQVRWPEGLYCPHCRSESVIKHGSYREYQRYLCKDCGRTFNPKTGTIFAHAKIGLNKLLFAFYAFLRFNTSIRQLDAELTVSYRSLRRRVEQFARTLDAPAIKLVGPVEIDEVYVTAGLKGRERDQEPRSRGLSSRSLSLRKSKALSVSGMSLPRSGYVDGVLRGWATVLCSHQDRESE
jgi:transposase-like protein